MEKKKIIKLNLKKLYGGATNLESVLIREKGDNHNNKMIGEITKLIEAVKNNDTTLSNMNFPISMPSQEYMQRTPTNITDQAEDSIAEERLNNLQLSEQNTKLMNENKELIQTLENLKENPELVKSEDLKKLEDINSKLTQNISNLQSENEELREKQSRIEKELVTAKNDELNKQITDLQKNDSSKLINVETGDPNNKNVESNNEAISRFKKQVEKFKEIKNEKEAVMLLWISEAFSCNDLIKLLDEKNPLIKRQGKNSYISKFLSSDIIGTCVPDSNITIDGKEDCKDAGDLIYDMINQNIELFKIEKGEQDEEEAETDEEGEDEAEAEKDEEGTDEAEAETDEEGNSSKIDEQEITDNTDEQTDYSVHFFTGGLRRGVQTASNISKNIADNGIKIEINISKFLNEGRMRSRWFRSYGHTPPIKSDFHFLKEKKNENNDTETKTDKKEIYTQIWEKLYWDKDNSINWNKYFDLTNKQNELWLEYFFSEDTNKNDFKNIIKYEEDLLQYYWFRYYTPFMPNIITKKNFFMNHITDMFKSKYLPITTIQVGGTILSEEGFRQLDVPVAKVKQGGGNLRIIRLSDYSDDQDFRYNNRTIDRNPRIIKLKDYSDDLYDIYQNFKQKGGFFGDCTSLITNIQSEFQILIEKSPFDNSDKKKLKKILKCIKNNPILVKKNIKLYLNTIEKNYPQYEKEISLIKNFIDNDFNFDKMIKEIQDNQLKKGNIEKYLLSLIKLFNNEELTEAEFDEFTNNKIDIPEDMPKTVSDLTQYFKDNKLDFPIDQKILDFIEIFYDVFKPKEKKSLVPFSTPKIPEDVKKMFKEFFVPSEPFGKFNGKIVIMIGHKGLMKYVTKVDESINNLTIISQIVTNEQYYLNYETGQFIHSGYYDGKYFDMHESKSDLEKNNVKTKCEITTNQVCKNIIDMKVNDGNELNEPNSDINNSEYDKKVFEFMFAKDIKVYQSGEYKYVFFGKENIEKFNNENMGDEINPDYNFYYIQGEYNELISPNVIPMYLKVYQKDNENAFLYISSNGDIVKNNFNGPFEKDKNNFNIDQLQKMSIKEKMNPENNKEIDNYFRNIITDENGQKSIIITLESMEDIKTIEKLTLVKEKIQFNESKNFSEPLSVPDKWIHVSMTDKKETELTDFLKKENYDEFKTNIIDNELKNDNDIILLYRIKL